MNQDYDLKSLLESLDKVKLNVKNVILIKNNPVFPDEDSFLQLLPKLMPPYSNPVMLRQEEMVLVNTLTTQTLYAEARKKGILTIDISSEICRNGMCFRWLDGEWLYGDDNHLSVDGVDLLKPILFKVLEH